MSICIVERGQTYLGLPSSKVTIVSFFMADRWSTATFEKKVWERILESITKISGFYDPINWCSTFYATKIEWRLHYTLKLHSVTKQCLIFFPIFLLEWIIEMKDLAHHSAYIYDKYEYYVFIWSQPYSYQLKGVLQSVKSGTRPLLKS